MNGSIHIYEVNGRLMDKIEVGEQIDHITARTKRNASVCNQPAKQNR